MPKLGIEIENNDIDKTTNKFKKLNTQVDKTGKGVDNVGTSAQRMGTKIGTAFSAFLVGGAIQKGFSAIKDDMMATHNQSLAIVKTLREIDFLKGDVGKAQVRKIASKLNLSVEEVKQVMAPLFSANPNMSMDQIGSMGENALIEGKTSSIPAKPLAMTVSGLVNADETFSKLGSGEVGAQNFVKEAVSLSNMGTEQTGVLRPLFAAGAIAGISPFELAAGFKTLVKGGQSPEVAVTMLKGLMNQWKKYGKQQGMSLMSFIEYGMSIEDAMKRSVVLPSEAESAAGAINLSGRATFEADTATLLAAGSRKTSDSVKAYNAKRKSDPGFRALELSVGRKNIKDNIEISGEKQEQNEITASRYSQVGELFQAFAKEWVNVLLPESLSLDPESNIQTVLKTEKLIRGRSEQVNLDNTLKSINANGQVNRKLGGNGE